MAPRYSNTTEQYPEFNGVCQTLNATAGLCFYFILQILIFSPSPYAPKWLAVQHVQKRGY